MAKDTRSINLLPNKGDSLFTQFLSWGVSVGRLLIILTESLALGVFIYRFSLDMKIVDLHDQIKAESFIIQNFKASEDKFRNVQERISLAKTYSQESTLTPTAFSDIADMGRGRVTFKTLLVSNESVKIEAQAPTANQLAQFVDALKQYPLVSSVSIDKVENRPITATILMTISATLKTAGQPTPVELPVEPAEGGLQTR